MAIKTYTVSPKYQRTGWFGFASDIELGSKRWSCLSDLLAGSINIADLCFKVTILQGCRWYISIGLVVGFCWLCSYDGGRTWWAQEVSSWTFSLSWHTTCTGWTISEKETLLNCSDITVHNYNMTIMTIEWNCHQKLHLEVCLDNDIGLPSLGTISRPAEITENLHFVNPLCSSHMWS